MVSDRLSREMGQRVVVDTRPGAGGVLAMDLTANAPPDGYTWYPVQLEDGTEGYIVEDFLDLAP